MAQQPQLNFPKGILPIVFIGIILLIRKYRGLT